MHDCHKSVARNSPQLPFFPGMNADRGPRGAWLSAGTNIVLRWFRLRDLLVAHSPHPEQNDLVTTPIRVTRQQLQRIG